MSSHPRADPGHEVGGTTHQPDQPQIPETDALEAIRAAGGEFEALEGATMSEWAQLLLELEAGGWRLVHDAEIGKLQQSTFVAETLLDQLQRVTKPYLDMPCSNCGHRRGNHGLLCGEANCECKGFAEDTRSKATDAAKFAEREYERVCEERDRLAAVLEALSAIVKAVDESEQFTWQEIEELAKPELMGDGEWASAFIDIEVNTETLMAARAALQQADSGEGE